MKLDHSELISLLQRAYSAEKAAAFAYQGHAGSLQNKDAKQAVNKIEKDEWEHRDHVQAIMRRYDIPVSMYYELRYHLIGKMISLSCYVIGWFMPYFFAGKLESGNVCEYLVMLRHFHTLGIRDHDDTLYKMAMTEKDHEIHFLNQIKDSPWMPFFEKAFAWGKTTSLNDVQLETKYPVEQAHIYCQKQDEKNAAG